MGDVSNDVSDEVLRSAFEKYPSFTKAKVIRDRLSEKVCLALLVAQSPIADTRALCIQAKYGFVAFSDPEDFLKAWKEMDGARTLHLHRHRSQSDAVLQESTLGTDPSV